MDRRIDLTENRDFREKEKKEESINDLLRQKPVQFQTMSVTSPFTSYSNFNSSSSFIYIQNPYYGYECSTDEIEKTCDCCGKNINNNCLLKSNICSECNSKNKLKNDLLR